MGVSMQLAFIATDGSTCWYLVVRVQTGHVESKVVSVGSEPNPAGAEAWLSVIRQGFYLKAKWRGHRGQMCLPSEHTTAMH